MRNILHMQLSLRRLIVRHATAFRPGMQGLSSNSTIVTSEKYIPASTKENGRHVPIVILTMQIIQPSVLNVTHSAPAICPKN